MFKLNNPIKKWAACRVWVIGASEGIGLALAQELIKLGSEVTVSARNEARLREIYSDKARIRALDVSKLSDCENLLAEFSRDKSTPDIVFWLPAMYQPLPIVEEDSSLSNQIITANLTSAFHVLPGIVRTWCKKRETDKNTHLHWIWFSSLAAYGGLPNAADYGASKAGIMHLSETSYIELRKKGINVTLVSPGFVDTRLTKKNTFPMPFIIPSQKAALITLRGLSKGKYEIHFPKTMSLIFKLFRLLPRALYFRLARFL